MAVVILLILLVGIISVVVIHDGPVPKEIQNKGAYAEFKELINEIWSAEEVHELQKVLPKYKRFMHYWEDKVLSQEYQYYHTNFRHMYKTRNNYLTHK